MMMNEDVATSAIFQHRSSKESEIVEGKKTLDYERCHHSHFRLFVQGIVGGSNGSHFGQLLRLRDFIEPAITHIFANSQGA